MSDRFLDDGPPVVILEPPQPGKPVTAAVDRPPRVEGLTPEELDEQGATVEAVVAAALALVAEQTAASVLAGIPAVIGTGLPAYPWVSLDDVAIVPTLWLRQLDEQVMPAVRAVFDQTADHVHEQIQAAVDADPTLYGTPEFDLPGDVVEPPPVPEIPDVTAEQLMSQARNRLVGIGDTLWADIRQQIVEGIGVGESIEQLGKRIEATAGVAEPRARTIARTECLLGDTRVDGARVTSLFRRFYHGEIIEVVTASGRKISGTPNHPVFTASGWRGLGEVAEGDDLICYEFEVEDSGPSGYQDVGGPPSTLGQIFDSVEAVVVPMRERTGKPDFHGDGSPQCYVDVLRPAGVLLYGHFATLDQCALERIFSPADASTLSVLASRSDVPRDIPIDVTSRRFSISEWYTGYLEPASDPAVTTSVGLRDLVHRQSGQVCRDDCVVIPVGLYGVTEARSVQESSGLRSRSCNTATVDPTTDRSFVEARYCGDSLAAEPRAIQRDYVLSVNRRNWAGQVFNLTTIDGYFLANGFYTSNTVSVSNGAAIAQARSAGVPMTKSWLDTHDTRTRPTHKEAGRTQRRVPLDQPFEVGGFQLDFPGDPSGPPQEVINERCAIGFELGVPEPPVTAAVGRKTAADPYVRDAEGQFAKTGTPDLSKMKVPELRAEVKKRGLKGLSKAPKAQLVEALRQLDKADSGSGKVGKVDSLPRMAKRQPALAAAKATNPNFGSTSEGPTYPEQGKVGERWTPALGPLPAGAFEENCTNAVNAFEMRMRGYDVTAAPLDVLSKYGYAAGRTYQEFDELFTEAWRLPDGKPHGRSMASQKWRSFAEIDSEIERDWPDGGRGVITVGKHVFNVVKERGKARYVEAQYDATPSRNVTRLYKSRFKGYDGWSGGIDEGKLIRLDDLVPTDSILETVEAAK